MKTFAQFRNGFGKVMLLAALAIPMVVSCYDDSEMREKLEILTDKIADIEEKLNTELLALHGMLSGKILISDVSKNASTGITTVTLTNGSKLELLPKTDLQSVVSYMNIGGECFWAYLDADGNKQLFQTSDGMPVPVMTETPEVVVEDGDYYIIVGGMKYPLGGNSVFSDYEVIADEISGEVLAVTFTFGEDMTFTVSVDGASGFHFMLPGGLGNATIIDNYYVACGLTASVQVDMKGVEDYVLQTPEGWRVKEREDIYTGEKYFDITAPSYARVQNNEVDAEGYLKVVAVLKGGKATTTKLYLTSNPFKQFSAVFGNVNVSMYNGLERYFYGVCLASEYDEETVKATVEGLLEAYDYPDGYGEASEKLVDMPVAEILGSTPAYGEDYVFWALPLQYYSSDEDAYYFVQDNTIVSTSFKSTSVSFDIKATSFSDALLSMDTKGVESYYLGLTKAEDYMMQDVLYNLNRGFLTAVSEPLTYEGSVFTLAGVKADFDTDYVVWFAEAHEEGKVYTESDVLVREFSTLAMSAGGNIDVKAAEPALSALEVEVSLSAPKAGSIYYSFLKTSEAKKYADDAAKADYLFKSGQLVMTESVVAKLSDSPSVTPKVSTAYAFFAVAVDVDGKYGKVYSAEYSTTTIPFTDMVVNISVPVNAPGDVQIAISAEGASEYLYWVGKTSENFFKSTNYLGETTNKAEVYMFLNPSAKDIVNSMANYPLENGVIASADMELGTEYAVVAIAKDADGNFSHAALHKFKARSKNLGTIVMSSDPKWEASRPTVEFLPEYFEPGSGMMQGRYAYNVTLPLGYTAYVVSGTTYYYDYELAGNEIGDQLIQLMTDADGQVDADIQVDSSKEFPYNSKFYHFAHGNAEFGHNCGSAIVWASQEFHDKACPGHEVKTETLANGVTVPCETVIYINDGNKLMFFPGGTGSKTEVVDQVYIVIQDTDFNCYEPYVYDVPVEYFVNAKE